VGLGKAQLSASGEAPSSGAVAVQRCSGACAALSGVTVDGWGHKETIDALH
jgi:hypothetical protein